MRRPWLGRSRDRDRCPHRSPDDRYRCQLVRDHPPEACHIAQVDGQRIGWYGVVAFPPPRHAPLPWAKTFPRDET